MRALHRIAVPFVAAATLLAGCGESSPSSNANGTPATTGAAAPAASASAKPAAGAAEFEAAIADLATKPYAFLTKAKSGPQVKGSVDPTAGNVAQVADLPAAKVKVSVTVVGKDYYAKLDGVQIPGATNKWIHFEPGKLQSFNKLLINTAQDPTGLTLIAKAIVTAKKDGTKITGTFDATKVGDGVGGIGADSATVLGDKAKAIPFTATLDAQGKITALSFMVPEHGEEKADTMTTTYSAVGTAVKIAKPTPVVEANEQIYAGLNG